MTDFRTIETVKRLQMASEVKKIEGDQDRLKGLVLNAVQSSSITRSLKALKATDKDAGELKQGSMKRNASAMEDIKTEVKKLKQETMVAIDLLKLCFDIL